ncbi:hypothetical protein C8R45DRAFT_923563 [Mycena sanguinolenta]|nr:hypothetical protein C8R45DRAFT_923563 [Mycena sanguinolenta]
MQVYFTFLALTPTFSLSINAFVIPRRNDVGLETDWAPPNIHRSTPHAPHAFRSLNDRDQSSSVGNNLGHEKDWAPPNIHRTAAVFPDASEGVNSARDLTSKVHGCTDSRLAETYGDVTTLF